jgi:hypothetical protein
MHMLCNVCSKVAFATIQIVVSKIKKNKFKIERSN